MRQYGKLVMLQLLRGYKWAISPIFPPGCRYVPTCSEYAMEAVERYGAARGGRIALWRLLRCHPFAHGGYDPVVRQRVGFEPPHPSTRLGQAFPQRKREREGCAPPPTAHGPRSSSTSPVGGAI